MLKTSFFTAENVLVCKLVSAIETCIGLADYFFSSNIGLFLVPMTLIIFDLYFTTRFLTVVGTELRYNIVSFFAQRIT